MSHLHLGILVVSLRPLQGFCLNPFLSSHLKRMKNHFLAAIRGLCGGLLIGSMMADCPIAQGLPSIHQSIAAFEWSTDALAFAKQCFGHFGFEVRSDHLARQQEATLDLPLVSLLHKRTELVKVPNAALHHWFLWQWASMQTKATRPANLALVDPGMRPCQDGRI